MIILKNKEIFHLFVDDIPVYCFIISNFDDYWLVKLCIKDNLIGQLMC